MHKNHDLHEKFTIKKIEGYKLDLESQKWDFDSIHEQDDDMKDMGQIELLFVNDASNSSETTQ